MTLVKKGVTCDLRHSIPVISLTLLIMILIYDEVKNKSKGEVNEMKSPEIKEVNLNKKEVESLKGTLFSTLVFVGGGIIVFILTLFIFYMIRV